MHPLQPQPYRPPAILPAINVPTGSSLPWRTAPHVHGTAAFGTSDLAAQHWIWQSRFGPIVIEVRGNDVFVNGDRVAPHAP